MLVGAGLLLSSACDDSRVATREMPAGVDGVLQTPTRMYRELMAEPEVRLSQKPRVDTEALEFAQWQEEAESCRKRIEAARLTPTMPGAPKLEEQRELVLARGKAEPVLFLETPQFRSEVSKGIQAQRRRIEQTHFPRDTMLGLLRHFSGILPQLRQLILRDGYFYTDDPAAARELTVRVGFEDLFREPKLTLLRGSRQMQLARRDGLYYYADGPMKGERARLLLFDRVWVTGHNPGPHLHVDVRSLATVLGFDQMQIDHLGERNITAQLLFEDEWVPALLRRDGTELSLECLFIEAEDRARIGRARDQAFRRAIAVAALRRAIVSQIRMGLPFDEPRHEVGQQDGKLRPRWERAYFAGRSHFRFNRDRYSVFDELGNPIAPQVCIDFITESLERASGMRYAKRGQKPHQVNGEIDFDELLGSRRRQELAFRQLAKSKPEIMQLHDYPMGEWVKYERVPRFFSFLRREKDHLRSGDIVIIRGRAPWDRYEKVHTHTFFVYESDPVTGMPVLLAGNSGKPRLVTWDSEMLRAPKRSIRHRIRLNSEWLYDNFVTQYLSEEQSQAAPLVVAERTE